MDYTSYNLDAKIKIYDERFKFIFENLEILLNRDNITPGYVDDMKRDIKDLQDDLMALQVGGNTALINDLTKLYNHMLALNDTIKTNLNQTNTNIDKLYKDQGEKITNLTKTVKDLQDSYITIAGNFTTELNVLRSNLEKTYDDLRQEILNNKADVTSKDLDNLKNELTTQIIDKENTLTSGINSAKEELNIRVDSMENSLEQRMDNIKTVITTRIDGIETSVNKNKADIMDINNTISQHTTKLDSYDNRINSVTQDIGTLQGAKDIMSNQIELNKNSVANMVTKITELTPKVDLNKSDIAILKSKVDNITNNTNNLGGLTTQVNTNTSNITDLTTKVNTNIDKVTDLTSKVTTNTSNITDLTTQLETKINEAKTNITTNESEITKVKQQYDSLSSYTWNIMPNVGNMFNQFSSEFNRGLGEQRDKVQVLETQSTNYDMRLTHLEQQLDGLFDKMYPVGSVYITLNSLPSWLPGTWEDMSARYGDAKLFIAQDNEKDIQKGSNFVTLTTAQLPNHNHSLTSWYDDFNYNIGGNFQGSTLGGTTMSIPNDKGGSNTGGHSRYTYTNSTGSGAQIDIAGRRYGVKVYVRRS